MKSMTGFGRGEASGDGFTCSVEAASVNRKQLEMAISLPRELNELETSLRNEVAACVSRGRVNVSVRIESGNGSSSALKIDHDLAAEYLAASQALAERLKLPNDVTMREALRWPGVAELERSEVNPEAVGPVILTALKLAVKQLIVMRTQEGEALKQDMLARMKHLAGLIEQIAAVASTVVEHHRRALHQRLADAGLTVDLNDERLVKELVLYSDRCDISEELTRARSHLAQFHHYLASHEPVGRPLDFLTQEIFREFNTMGSKANNAGLAHLVVEAKTEIEKIREQVQNVE